MPVYLQSLDKAIFLAVNRELTHPILDFLLSFITDFRNFQVALIFVLFLVLLVGDRRLMATCLLIGLGVALSDSLVDLIKDALARPRPCQELPLARVLVKCGRNFGFPSGHAANTATLSLITSFRHRRLGFFFYPFMALMAYSRIYVGAHYPSDVLGGMALGLVSSLVVMYGVRALSPLLLNLVRPLKLDLALQRAFELRERLKRRAFP